jgi:hypothetical protein
MTDEKPKIDPDVMREARELFIGLTGWEGRPGAEAALKMIREGSHDEMPMLLMAAAGIMHGMAIKAHDQGCEVCGYDCAGMPAPPAYCPVQWRGELERLTVKARAPHPGPLGAIGYMVPSREWLEENRDTAIWLLENLDRIQRMIKEAHS